MIEEITIREGTLRRYALRDGEYADAYVMARITENK